MKNCIFTFSIYWVILVLTLMTEILFLFNVISTFAQYDKEFKTSQIYDLNYRYSNNQVAEVFFKTLANSNEKITSTEDIAFYYVSGTQHGIWRANKKPDGTWDRGMKIILDGVFNGNAVDPDVIRLEDGRYILYYFLGNFVEPFPSNQGLYCAISNDGINFKTEGKIIELQGLFTDPTVVRLTNGNYLLATVSGMDLIIATSTDGIKFIQNGSVIRNAGIPELTLLNNGSIRLFYNSAGGICSYISTDNGKTWQIESGLRLSAQFFIADPSVIKRSDGSWVMFVKGLNNTGLKNPKGHNVRMATSNDGFTYYFDGGVLLDSASVPEGVIVITKNAPNSPLLVFPLNGSQNVPINTILKWNTSKESASYNLQVSNKPNFSNLIVDKTNLKDTTFNLTNLEHNTTYYWRVSATNEAGSSQFSEVWRFTTESSTSIEGNTNQASNSIILEQNYPNPCDLSTTIRFSIPTYSKVTLKVFDLFGNELIVLINAELESGEYSIEFDTRSLSEGVYYYTLSTSNSTKIKVMELIR